MKENLSVIIMRAGYSDAEMYKRVLKNFKVDFCIAVNNEDPKLMEDNYVWVNSSFAKWSDYDVDWNDVEPLDEGLIEKMAWCETVSINVINRYEDKRVIPYDQRRRQYLRHLRLWDDLIRKKKINLYITGGVPHELPEWIIFCLCRHYNIPTILFQTGTVRHTTFIMDDWKEPVRKLECEYKRLSSELSNASEEEIELSPEYEEYFQAQTGRGSMKPWDDWVEKKGFWTDLKNILIGIPSSAARLLKNWTSLKYWITKVKRYSWMKKTKRMYGFYNKNASDPDLGQKFVYLPLQMQPECSTAPQAGAYVDQLLIAQMLSVCLPDDVYIYIKEHPAQLKWYEDGRGRTLDFYKDLLEVERVKFVTLNFSSADLIKHCVFIATATGTAAFEGIFQGKPSLLFGHRFFQRAPGIYLIKTVEDCKKAISEVLAGEAPDLKDVKIFLKAMENLDIHAAFWRDFGSEEGFTEKDSINSLTSAIVNEINALE